MIDKVEIKKIIDSINGLRMHLDTMMTTWMCEIDSIKLKLDRVMSNTAPPKGPPRG